MFFLDNKSTFVKIKAVQRFLFSAIDKRFKIRKFNIFQISRLNKMLFLRTMEISDYALFEKIKTTEARAALGSLFCIRRPLGETMVGNRAIKNQSEHGLHMQGLDQNRKGETF